MLPLFAVAMNVYLGLLRKSVIQGPSWGYDQKGAEQALKAEIKTSVSYVTK